MSSGKPSGTDSFLSFGHDKPSLMYVTAETNDFDPATLRAWRDEGYRVRYIPFNGGGRKYEKVLLGLADDLELGEKYAIVGT